MKNTIPSGLAAAISRVCIKVSLALCLFFGAAPATLQAQDADSLRYWEVLKVASKWVDNRNLDSALFYIEPLLQEIDQERFTELYIEGAIQKTSVLMYTGRLDQAEEVWAEIKEKVNEKLQRPSLYFGWVAMTEAEIAYYRQDLSRAIELFKGAIGEYEPIKTVRSWRRKGRIYNIIGVAYIRLSYYDLASEYLDKAVTTYKQTPNNELYVAGPMSNLGALYLRMGQYDKSIDLYTDLIANRIKSAGKNDSQLRIYYTNLSLVYAKMQQFNLALEYKERAFRLSQQLLAGNDERMLEQHITMAKALIDANRDAEARAQLERAQQIMNGLSVRPPNQQGNIDMQIGRIYLRDKQYTKAIRYYEKSIQSFREAYGDLDFNQAVLLSNITECYMQMENYALAEQTQQEAIAMMRQIAGEKHDELSKMYVLLSQVHDRAGNHSAALQASEMAVDANEGYTQSKPLDFERIQNKNLLMFTLLNKALHYEEAFSRNKDDTLINEAMHYLSLCDSVVNRIQQNESIDDQLYIIDTLNFVYDRAVMLQFDRYQKGQNVDHLENALYFANQGKNTLLRQQLYELDQKKYGVIPEELVSLEQQLKTNISYIQGLLYNMQPNEESAIADSVTFSFYKDRLFDKQRSLDSLKQVFQTDFPTYFNTRYGVNYLPVKELQNSLPKATQLIQFVTTPEHIYAFSIRQSALDFKQIDRSETLDQELSSYLKALADPTTDPSIINALGNKLYQQLLSPLGPLAANLIIVPDGQLSLLPFDLLALEDSSEGAFSYVVEDHNVSYAHSAFSINEKNKGLQQKDNRLLALATSYNTPTDQAGNGQVALSPLQWTINEVESLLEVYEGESYTEALATEANFKTNAKDKTIIHFASHGIIDHVKPFYSKIVLENDPSDSLNDGNLYVHELYNMSLDANLVVLSACNTASGELAKGEGVINLGRGFFYAGVPSVVMSHWQVDDESTSILMTHFYRFLAEGLTKSEAMRKAKIKFMDEASPNKKHPFYWGAFIVMGDDSPVVRSGAGNWVYLLLLLGLATAIYWRAQKRKGTKAT